MKFSASKISLAGLAVVLLMLIPLGDLTPWPLVGHLPALCLWFGTGLLLVAELGSSQSKTSMRTKWLMPLALLLYGIASATLLAGDWQSVFLGLNKQWLGSFSLVCCIVTALLASRHINLSFLQKYYAYIAGLATLSLLVSIPQLLRGERLGGVVSQPDIVAILMGTGLVVGLMVKMTSWSAKAFYLSQIVLVSAILLTRTRAVIYLLPIWLAATVIQHVRTKAARKRLSMYAIAAGLVMVVLAGWYAAPRVLSVDRAAYGFSYRYDLVAHSTGYLAVMPPWGFGPGGLGRVFGNYHDMPKSLQYTLLIDQKVPYDSHNIVLDRFIEYGWIAGFAYIVVLIAFVWAAWRTRKDTVAATLSAVGGFLVIQQLITSTVISLELLTWTALLTVIVMASREPQGAAHD